MSASPGATTWPKQRLGRAMRSVPMWIGVFFFSALLVFFALRAASSINTSINNNRRARESGYVGDDGDEDRSAADTVRDDPPPFQPRDVLRDMKVQLETSSVWTQSSSSSSPSSEISSVEYDSALAPNAEAIFCSTKSSFQKGFFYDYRTGRKAVQKGFCVSSSSPLKPFEVSPIEMSCAPDSVFVRARQQQQASAAATTNNNKKIPMWVNNPFHVDKQRDPSTAILTERLSGSAISASGAALVVGDVVGRFFDMQPTRKLLTDAAVGDNTQQQQQQQQQQADIDLLFRNYSVFQFHTSSDFVQWLPWEPRPVRQVYRRNYSVSLRGAMDALSRAPMVSRWDPKMRKKKESKDGLRGQKDDQQQQQPHGTHIMSAEEIIKMQELEEQTPGQEDFWKDVRTREAALRVARRMWRAEAEIAKIKQQQQQKMTEAEERALLSSKMQATSQRNIQAELRDTFPPSMPDFERVDARLDPIVPPPPGVYGAWHDPASENVYRVSNFCLEPHIGLSGFIGGTHNSPSRRAYEGKDDTHQTAHNDGDFRNYFNNEVRGLSEPPEFLDSRPVIFFPVPRHALISLYHLFVRTLALTGILRTRPMFFGSASERKPDTSSNRINLTRSGGGGNGLDSRLLDNLFASTNPFEFDADTQPLLVLVRDAVEESWTQRTSTAMGFMLRALDIPFASVPSNQMAGTAYVRRMACSFSKHAVSQFFAAQEWIPEYPAAPSEPTLSTTTAPNSSSSNNRSNNNSNVTTPSPPTTTMVPPIQYLAEKQRSLLDEVSNCTAPRNDDSGDPRHRYLPLKWLARATDGMSTGTARICFSHGVAWQNCWGPTCGGWGGTPPESYSFSNFARNDPPRRAMLGEWVQRVEDCLPFNYSDKERRRRDTQISVLPSAAAAGDVPPPSLSSSPSSSSSSSSSDTSSSSSILDPLLPRVFWDVRTSVRRIRGFGLFIDQVRSALQGKFVSSIVVREPWRSSRAAYLDELRESDIFIGVHGAAFTQTSYMLEGGVVAEMTVPYHENPVGRGPLGWFATFSSIRGHEHFAIRLYQHYRNSFLVPPQALALYLKQASCRWLTKHKKPSLVIAEEIDSLTRNGSGSSFLDPGSLWRKRLGASGAAAAVALAATWRECRTLETTAAELQVLDFRKYAADTTVDLLTTMTTRRKNQSSLTLTFPITKSHSQHVSSTLLMIQDADSGEQFRNMQFFESAMADVWQVLFEVFAGDGFIVRPIPPPVVSNGTTTVNGDGGAPKRRWRRLMCLDPRVRPPPLDKNKPQPTPRRSRRRSQRGKKLLPEWSALSEQYNSIEARLGQDRSCLFWGKDV